MKKSMPSKPSLGKENMRLNAKMTNTGESVKSFAKKLAGGLDKSEYGIK